MATVTTTLLSGGLESTGVTIGAGSVFYLAGTPLVPTYVGKILGTTTVIAQATKSVTVVANPTAGGTTPTIPSLGMKIGLCYFSLTGTTTATVTSGSIPAGSVIAVTAVTPESGLEPLSSLNPGANGTFYVSCDQSIQVGAGGGQPEE